MQVYRDSLAPFSVLSPTPRPRFRKKSEKKIIKVMTFTKNLIARLNYKIKGNMLYKIYSEEPKL